MKLSTVANSHLDLLLGSFAIPLLLFGMGTIAHAEFFGISYDNTCKTMIKNNVTSDCPTYEDIITLYPDTSIKGVSGEFGYRDGIYQRLPTKFSNSFEYYRFWTSPILFVDPPVETRDRIHLIEIKANLDQYLLRGEKPSFNGTEYSLTLGQGRFIDDSCRNAAIDSSQWLTLLGDTLFHMSNNCSSNSTTFISKTTVQLSKVTHDITTSYKYKLEAWQKEMINRCGHKVCIYESEQPSPP